MSETVKTKKGFIQVNISGLIFHPGTEAEKARDEHLGDFVEAQPIMYDIFIEDGVALSPAELIKIPEGMAQEVVTVLAEVSRLIREHQPDPTKLIQLGGAKEIKAAVKQVLDASGAPISTSKH